MTKRIRIVAQPRDPLAINRLVRLLIAQAQAELKRRQLAGEVEPATGQLSEESGHE
jgi:hypothetical protein